MRRMASLMVLGVLLAAGCGEMGSSESSGTYTGGPSGGRAIGDTGGGGEGGGEGGGCDGCEEIPAGQLTAGEWRDLDHWSDWLDVLEGHADAADWGYDTTSRIPVRVEGGGYPVVDARVSLLDATGAVEWEARTDVEGAAELFAGVLGSSEGPYTVRVEAGGEVAEVSDVSPSFMETLEVDLGAAWAPRRSLDLMFVMDTTGSMGDELRYIQAELRDVIERSQRESLQSFDLRTSLGFYRDSGDTYVVRSHPFTSDLDEAMSHLTGESAGGGGDWPEAVDRALAEAIDGREWRDEATARLLFLVLDAPPHEEQEILSRLREATVAAAAKGVRIIPLSGTGIDQRTEMLLRQEAILTGGTYTFLTDHSGIGGSHIEPTLGAYDVELLNDLMVRLIVEAMDGPA